MKLCRLLMFGCSVLALVFTACSPEDGKQGPTGATGATGDTGPKGDSGDDLPNKDFYFQDGFKGYDGTNDASLSSFASSGSDSEIDLRLNTNVPDQNKRGVIHFSGVDLAVHEALVGEGEDCNTSFYMNQAILYLFVTAEDADIPQFDINIGFYGDQDPLFQEEQVSWTAANDNDDWGDDGAESEEWAGPFSDDSYAYRYLPKLGPHQNIGWVPILLPRSIVENWLCNPSLDKGLRLRLTSNAVTNGTDLSFASSEHEEADLRPLLVIETEKIETSEASKASVSNAKAQDWETKTYAEKMAPLYKYLAAKN
nr:hypothetical protein [Allomuricauda sp.]